jgi:hypothetical protein
MQRKRSSERLTKNAHATFLTPTRMAFPLPVRRLA